MYVIITVSYAVKFVKFFFERKTDIDLKNCVRYFKEEFYK